MSFSARADEKRIDFVSWRRDRVSLSNKPCDQFCRWRRALISTVDWCGVRTCIFTHACLLQSEKEKNGFNLGSSTFLYLFIRSTFSRKKIIPRIPPTSFCIKLVGCSSSQLSTLTFNRAADPPASKLEIGDTREVIKTIIVQAREGESGFSETGIRQYHK